MTNLINNRETLSMDDLTKVNAGTVNKNPSPNKPDAGIDQIINGKNYDAIAQKIADGLTPDRPRTRNVENDVDIYDCEI